MGRHDHIPVMQETPSKFEGYFDTKEIYHALRDFLEKERHYDTSEKDFTEKKDANAYKFSCKIQGDQQFNDYYKAVILYGLDVQGKLVEVEVDGKTKLLTHGKITLYMNSWIAPDYLSKRHDGALGHFLGQLYDHFFGKKELNECALSTVMDVGRMNSIFRQQVNSTILK